MQKAIKDVRYAKYFSDGEAETVLAVEVF